MAQDIALAATAVQAEIAVTAQAERGTVNRALDEQRNAVNIVTPVSAEQISKSPTATPARRAAGEQVTVQDGKYVVRGLGKRYTTTRSTVPGFPVEPGAKWIPLDVFPLPAGGSPPQDLHPEQSADFSGAEVNLRPGSFLPSGPSPSASGGWNSAATANHRQAPDGGPEWLGFAGSERQPDPVRAAGDLRGITQTEANR